MCLFYEKKVEATLSQYPSASKPETQYCPEQPNIYKFKNPFDYLYLRVRFAFKLCFAFVLQQRRHELKAIRQEKVKCFLKEGFYPFSVNMKQKWLMKRFTFKWNTLNNQNGGIFFLKSNVVFKKAMFYNNLLKFNSRAKKQKIIVNLGGKDRRFYTGGISTKPLFCQERIGLWSVVLFLSTSKTHEEAFTAVVYCLLHEKIPRTYLPLTLQSVNAITCGLIVFLCIIMIINKDFACLIVLQENIPNYFRQIQHHLFFLPSLHHKVRIGQMRLCEGFLLRLSFIESGFLIPTELNGKSKNETTFWKWELTSFNFE
ncbi:hypothetical protein EGR_04085 [Echinococcus granulosus]|uniref:Uncharacterized protein n=1 Tax=Echinococcus granulosus TaxID=6210 RepID=W6URU5_ECHGR|nr:hypothetical protein EGR_04085 [Echinococcus granulosus]EUB61052.1 hypothetical protein EGR_04085 [Echinococcus granulosus]